MATEERPGRSLVFDINNEELSAYAENGYFKSFFDDEEDEENKRTIKAIRNSDFLYNITPEAKEEIANNRLIPSNLKPKAEAEAIEARQVHTRDLYARLRVVQDKLLSPYNDLIKTNVSNLEALLDGFPSDGLDDASKAQMRDIQEQIVKQKENLILSKIVVNPENGELCLMGKIGNSKQGGFAIRNDRVTLSSEEIEKETLRQMLFALGYKEGILGGMHMPKNFSKKLNKTIDEIMTEEEKKEPLDRAKIYINKSDKTEEELLDSIDNPLPEAVGDNEIPNVAGSTEARIEKVVVDREMTDKQKEAKRDEGISMVLGMAKSLGYSGAGFRKPLLGVIPTQKMSKISQGAGDLKYRKRGGWDCFYFTNGATDSKFRLATRDPKTGKITYNYQYMVATKVDKDGNVSFKYNIPNGGKAPYELFEMIAENSKKQGATHVYFGNTRGLESTDIRKACAQELIVPVGNNVDIKMKHIAMMLETAGKDKGVYNPEVFEYSLRLAEQMRINITKSRPMTNEERNFYNKLINKDDVNSFAMGDYNLSKFKPAFEGISPQIAKMEIDNRGKTQAVEPLGKMMAFKDFYTSYKAVVTDSSKIDRDSEETTATIGDLLDRLESQYNYKGLRQELYQKGFSSDQKLFDLGKSSGGPQFGKAVFESMLPKAKDEAWNYLEEKYATKGFTDNETKIANTAISKYSSDCRGMSADFKDFVNDNNYSITMPFMECGDIEYIPSKEAQNKYDEKLASKKKTGEWDMDSDDSKSQVTKKPKNTNNPKKGGRY